MQDIGLEGTLRLFWKRRPETRWKLISRAQSRLLIELCRSSVKLMDRAKKE
jgi:hypothetical protein